MVSLDMLPEIRTSGSSKETSTSDGNWKEDELF